MQRYYAEHIDVIVPVLQAEEELQKMRRNMDETETTTKGDRAAVRGGDRGCASPVGG